ncbi:hypothetical protein Dimus_031741, partial [Dionaea muscipula]
DRRKRFRQWWSEMGLGRGWRRRAWLAAARSGLVVDWPGGGELVVTPPRGCCCSNGGRVLAE